MQKTASPKAALNPLNVKNHMQAP
jgi:Protein of unknown function (DUF5131)